MLAVDQTRGMRNNNPMNIKDSAIVWNGESSQNKDPVFEEFKTPSAGIRAGGKLLYNYFKIYGIDTVSGLINRYAPPEDNNPTNNYVNHVAKRLGVAPDQAINVPSLLPELCAAIISFELGENPFSDSYIKKSLKEFTA